MKEELEKCEHELILIDEEYVGEECINIHLKCQKCGIKFKGIIYSY